MQINMYRYIYIYCTPVGLSPKYRNQLFTVFQVYWCIDWLLPWFRSDAPGHGPMSHEP